MKSALFPLLISLAVSGCVCPCPTTISYQGDGEFTYYESAKRGPYYSKFIISFGDIDIGRPGNYRFRVESIPTARVTYIGFVSVPEDHASSTRVTVRIVSSGGAVLASGGGDLAGDWVRTSGAPDWVPLYYLVHPKFPARTEGPTFLEIAVDPRAQRSKTRSVGELLLIGRDYTSGP